MTDLNVQPCEAVEALPQWPRPPHVNLVEAAFRAAAFVAGARHMLPPLTNIRLGFDGLVSIDVHHKCGPLGKRQHAVNAIAWSLRLPRPYAEGRIYLTEADGWRVATVITEAES